MPKFTTGQSKPEDSGRKKGVKNQNTEIRSMLRNLVIEEFPTYVKRLHGLDDDEYCKNFKDLLKYVVPQISSIKFEDSSEIKNASSLLKGLLEYEE